MKYQVEQYSTTFDIGLYEGEQMEKPRSAIVQLRYGGLHCPYDVINVSIPSTAIRTADGDNIKINGLRIMQLAEVKHWGDLKGKPLRAVLKDGRIVAIGHFLYDQFMDYKTPPFKEER